MLSRLFLPAKGKKLGTSAVWLIHAANAVKNVTLDLVLCGTPPFLLVAALPQNSHIVIIDF